MIANGPDREPHQRFYVAAFGPCFFSVSAFVDLLEHPAASIAACSGHRLVPLQLCRAVQSCAADRLRRRSLRSEWQPFPDVASLENT